MPRSRPLLRTLAGGVAALMLVAACTGGSDESSDRTTTSGVAASSSSTTASTDVGGSTTEVPLVPMPQEIVDGAYFADGPPSHIDPIQAVTLGETQVASLMFNGLTEIVTAGGVSRVEPAAAESWTASQDAKQFTFTLRKNLTFSNGERLLPSAFMRGWDMAADPERLAPFAHLLSVIDGYSEVEAGRADHLSGVQVDDGAMTITVTLSEPYADFPTRVSHVVFSPMPEARVAAEAGGTWETSGLIGNGPYVLAQPFEPSQFTLTLRTDRTEVGGLAKVTFRSFDARDAAAAAFAAGEVQSMAAASRAELNGASMLPLLQTYSWVFGMDDRSPLGGPDNVLLRQAIALSIDRTDIVEAMDGLGVAAEGLTPPGAVGYAPAGCAICRFDLDAAKALLAQHRKGGGEVPDSIPLVMAADNEIDQDAVKIVQKGLEELGLDAEVRALPSAELASELATGSCPGLCRAGWIWDEASYDNGLVEPFTAAGIGFTNLGHYASPAFDDAIASARAVADGAARASAYRAAELTVIDQDAAVVALAWSVSHLVLADGVEGVIVDAIGRVAYDRVTIAAGRR